MSKSSGSFLRLQTLIDDGIDPLAYRYLCLTTHYRSQLNFSDEALRSAVNGLERMRALVHALGAPAIPDTAYLARFQAELSNDLGLPRALALAWELLNSELPDGVKKATMLRFDQVFGLQLAHWQPVEVSIPAAVFDLMAQRERARQERRWPDADSLRQQARAMGYALEDTPQGQQVRKL